MPRIKPVQNAEGKSKELLDNLQKKIGGTPNIYKTLAQAPAALEGLLSFAGALSHGTLPAPLREQIALTVAGANQCDYCASAHTLLGKKAGLNDQELRNNVAGKAADGKTQAALNFVSALVKKQGHVTDADFKTLRDAGFNDGEAVEIIANTMINMFTNYFNHAVDTEIDFPRVETRKLASAA